MFSPLFYSCSSLSGEIEEYLSLKIGFEINYTHKLFFCIDRTFNALDGCMYK